MHPYLDTNTHMTSFKTGLILITEPIQRKKDNKAMTDVSRLQCRIFPSALNRNREASFPPIACSSSWSLVCLDFFFLWFVLETALPSDETDLFFFSLHTFSNDVSEKFQ